METEGVLQYRLLGAHPAASGRYHSFGFSGDTVSLASVVQDIVKQHQINLTKYKLEVRRFVPVSSERPEASATPVNNEKDALQMNSVLHSYDRIVVNVSRRHYLDGTAELAQEENATPQDSLKQVEGLLHSNEEVWHEDKANAQSRKQTVNTSTDDPHAFSRVTALSNKAFPLIPWLRKRYTNRTTLLPTPTKGICVLCEMECFEEIVLPCCHFSTCKCCLELAKTMLTNEEECPVCGAAKNAKNTLKGGVNTTLTPMKQENQSSSLTHTKTSDHITDYNAKNKNNNKQVDKYTMSRQRIALGSSTKGTKPGSSNNINLAVAFESDLTKNMPRILSLLDVADPLTAEAKKRRRISAVVAKCTDR
ncbi:uncharacterized protein TM35_000051640 [Trypanosoma theileri]|uniref:RING-type domain-containing protein n=1 Tax=Trypanosoma theileri TaxID=67003 RepID=A0A1X0P415_9TRYP|nr:uncharacterized protein TM35_000051640 [Trypanosoma theileri]ORC91568.1 hypothetical protein TM35_000051640 [Trypanosoma theileri]